MKIIHRLDCCDECEKDVFVFIEFGDDEDSWICLDCLRKAVKMLEDKEAKNDQSKTIQG